MNRAIEIVLALCGLLILGPVIGVLVIAVRSGSAGPGIFRQVRIGRNGRPFTCYKLRTMVTGAPSVPTHEIGSDQVTPLGRLLRATKLDELPQLWNVLVGDMSLVGPRPSLPSQSELIAERERRGVLVLRPGITGLAQVRGIDMSDSVRLAKVDAEYAAARSIGLDLRILLLTVVPGTRRGRIRA